ncbi:Protein of unknown function [Natronorubrum sediminis]|uniref:Archaeal Type IV pilin N-terminal domain-containing protein n=1 Tax=Natronorubrum sediminis TaxID=640943 RepID=A0A1H6FT85_9EURY|nr:type IV pilin [Natronorubrum sediminis]SEH12995.1 Protein of unknown function [Natronorubrum sediminis]
MIDRPHSSDSTFSSREISTESDYNGGKSAKFGFHTDARALSRLVGIVALLGVTVALATMVAVGASTWSLDSSPPTAAFSMTADGESSTITIDHDGGETIDVTEVELIVDIDGDELATQPPVPFVGAVGFDGTPDGPFNAEGDTEWEPGERAAFTIAETNDPALESGETVAVALYADGYQLATLEDDAT